MEGKMQYMRIDKSLTLQAKQIADHYGLDNQMSMAQEELAELVQAISKLRRAGIAEQKGIRFINARMHVSEEMADVLNMLLQLMHLLGNEELVKFWLQQKLDKTQRNIREEQNEET